MSRELALKVLFAREFTKDEPWPLMELLFAEEGADQSGSDFCRLLVRGVLEKQRLIDSVIARYAEGWGLDRMAGVDRNILRLALFEILFAEGIPSAVAVNEAIELAKIYGSGDSGRFVNGVLGKIIEELPTLTSQIQSES